jgi:hypothetical protein
MKKIMTALLIGFALASCSTPEPRPAPMQLDFSNMGRLTIATQDVHVVNRAYSTPQWAPYVGHLFEPRLADAVEKWGNEHIQSGGNAGHGTLIIKEASVTQQALPMEGGFDSWFTRQQATKYVGRVEVTFEVQNPNDRSTGIASAQAVHAVTLPEEPTEAEKYAAYRSLVEDLMKDLNATFNQSVREHMGHFLMSSTQSTGQESALSGSRASRAAPIAPVQIEPVQAAPARTAPAPDSSANPIVITSP